MEPDRYEIASAIDIHKFFRGYRSHPPTGWWFRGQANAKWRLLPKAGREQFCLPDGRCLGRFRRWSRQALAYLPDLPDNDWERLAVAQHFGLATCLLDWTFNPLVALFFACCEQQSEDGIVYCYDPALFVDEEVLDLSTVECNGAAFVPRAISARILNQKAAFTVHLPVTSEIPVIESPALKGRPNLATLRIPAQLKHELLKMLDDYGINHVTLFPDLEGLSSYVNWETENIIARR